VVAEHEPHQLVLGYDLDSGPLERLAPGLERGSPLARATGLRGRIVDDVSLEIRAGEIVGVTGLMGSGFEELPYLLGGALRAGAGALTLGGRTIDLATACPRDLLDAGVAL